MSAQRQRTEAGDAIIARELADAPPVDPPPADIPLDPAGTAGQSEDPPKPRRGRPPGSKNATGGRKPRTAKIDQITSAADIAVQRGAMLAAYVVSASPIPPERKMVWIEDTVIVSSPKGREAIVGSLRVACERNPKFAAFCARLIEASAYTGIGATVIFGLVLPIAMNHGVITLPPAMLVMMNEDETETPE